jgi:hypothetical protein
LGKKIVLLVLAISIVAIAEGSHAQQTGAKQIGLTIPVEVLERANKVIK